MVVGCVVSESISAQNQKKSVTDGRTDGQTDKSKIISLRFAGDNLMVQNFLNAHHAENLTLFSHATQPNEHEYNINARLTYDTVRRPLGQRQPSSHLRHSARNTRTISTLVLHTTQREEHENNVNACLTYDTARRTRVQRQRLSHMRHRTTNTSTTSALLSHVAPRDEHVHQK